MSPAQYVRVFREQWVIVAVAVVLGVLVAACVVFFQRPEFASQTTLYIAAQSSDTTASSSYDGQLLAQEKVKSYVEILEDPRVGELVAARLRGAVSAQEVTDSIQASVPPETSLIRMTVISSSPQRAGQIAEAVTQELPGLVDDLERPDPTRPPSVVVKVVRPPSSSSDAVSTSWPNGLLIGALVGLLLGCVAALLRASLDRTVRTADTLEAASGAPVLGTTLLDASESSAVVDTSPVAAEAYRHVRTSLAYLAVDTSNKVILLTSAMPGEGKSTALCNVAMALGQKEQRVVLVDADLRRPSIARLLQIDADLGVTTVLSQRASIDPCIRSYPGGSFDVLPSGPIPPNPSELLSSRRMGEMLAELRRRYDVVLLDAPPILPVTDAAELATYADGVVLVCRFGKTTTRTLARAVSLLRVASTPLVGSLLTMAPRKAGDFAYESDTAASFETRELSSLLSRLRLVLGRRPQPEPVPTAPARSAPRPPRSNAETNRLGESNETPHDDAAVARSTSA